MRTLVYATHFHILCLVFFSTQSAALDALGSDVRSDDGTTELPNIIDPEAAAEESQELFEGDIRVPDYENDMKLQGGQAATYSGVDLDAMVLNDDGTLQKNTFADGIIDEASLWPNAEVPYEISKTFGTKHVEIIKSAIAIFDAYTCVKFRPRRPEDKDYLKLVAGVDCSAFPGRKQGQQMVQLKLSGCMTSGIVQHELMHAIGFFHEHSRSDRDNYVDINWPNVADKLQFVNFLDANVSSFGEPYDFNSIMHYGENEFGIKKGDEQWTIRPKEKYNFQGILGQRSKLSQSDIVKINAMYKCHSKHIEVSDRRWPNAVIPYQFSSRFRSEDTMLILSAMREFEERTCVVFRPRLNEETDFVYFVSGLDCASSVGRIGGRQVLQLLKPKCIKYGIIQHQIMHLLGFNHEHERPDRDDYVDINWSNIDNRGGFRKFSESEFPTFGQPYDFNSITHFSGQEWSKTHEPGDWTIRAKENVHFQGTIGRGDKVSDGDILKVNLIYNCKAKGPCPASAGWRIFKNKCYYFSFADSGQSKHSFISARNDCRKKGAKLTEPTSDVIQNILLPTFRLWPTVLRPDDNVYISSCDVLNTDTTASIEVSNCDAELYYVCEKDAVNYPSKPGLNGHVAN